MTDPVFVEKARELSHGFAVVDLEKEAEVAIASALREAAETARNAWQPIETAPRDGTPILTYAAEDALDQHWRDYHRMKHMERRLVAMGRTDIVDDADKYADERMKG